MIDDTLQITLKDLEAKGLQRELRLVEGSQGPRVTIEGRSVLNFCSNNYLGLADDPRLRQAAVASIAQEGLGAGASRLVCGHLSSHQKLEDKLARFKGTQRCLLFSTGYMANVGIISSLFSRDDLILSDRLNHASIIDGILLSQARFKRYPHLDMEALEILLKEAGPCRKKAIITDSVFSMDGDLAPLDRIVELAQRHDCLVMVDEAHALGVMGEHGRGAVEHFGLEGKIPIQMGTLSKAVGSFGAYCCGSAELIGYLINKARSFIYTTGLPPSVAAASLKGIEIIEQDLSRRRRLGDHAELLRTGLKQLGFSLGTGPSNIPIIPVIVGDPALAVEFSRRLFEAGLFVSAIRPPTVPVGTARLRVTVMATHTKEDIEYLLSQFKMIGRDLGII